MTRIWILLLLASHALSQTNNYLVSSPADSAFLLAPGSTVELAVLVRSTAGAPQPNLSVRFGAPTSGPSGVFPDSTAAGRSWRDVNTDSTGVARARFTASANPGHFSVEAVAANSASGISFAFTVGYSGPTPAANINDIRNSFRASILNNLPDSNTLRLHGPFLIPAGSRLRPATFGPGDQPGYPKALLAPTWFAWVDDAPNTFFSHPTRYLELAASAPPSSPASVTAHAFYPVVVSPSGVATPLAGGLLQNTLHAVPANLLGTPLSSASSSLASKDSPLAATPAESCMFYGFGPNASYGGDFSASFDVNRLAAQLGRDLPRENIVRPSDAAGNPTEITRRFIKQAVEEFRRRGCKKVVFAFTGHGEPGERGDGLVLTNDGIGGGTDVMSYEDLAAEFQKLGPDVELCIVIESCFSGQAIPFFQGLGLKGSILTSSTADKVTLLGTATDLARGMAANTNDLTKVPEWITRNGSNSAKAGSPQSGAINATGSRAVRVPFVIFNAPGENWNGFFNRPKSAPPAGTLAFTFQVANAAIGTFSNNANMAANQGSAGVAATAVNFGFTPVNARGTLRPGDIAYAGAGGIRVGDLAVTPVNCFEIIRSTCTYEVERLGIFADKDQGDTFSVFTSNPLVAPVTSPLVFAPGATRATIRTTNPGTPGVASIQLISRLNAAINRTVFADFYTIEVSQLPNAAETAGNVSFMTRFNRQTTNHDCCYTPVDQNLIFDFQASNALRILSDGNTLPLVSSGTFNPATGRFTASGTQRVSTFQTMTSIEGTLNIVRSQNAASDARGVQVSGFTMTARVGSSGSLPGGQPEVVDATGTVIPTCSYTLNPPAIALNRNASTQFVTLTTAPNCAWTASRTGDFVTFTTATSGRGSARIYFNATQNDGALRSATLSIAGRTTTVSQAAPASGAPTVSGVVNGASFLGGVSPSSWVTISGSNLAAESRIWAGADFNGDRLPLRLNDTSVTIGGRDAFVYFVSPGQLNVLAPDNLPAGEHPLIVRRGALESNSFPIYVKSLSPGYFMFDAENRAYVAAVNADGVLAAKPNLYPGLATRPPAPGQIVLLYTTGLGPTSPATPADRLVPAPAPTASAVSLRIGGIDAEVLFVGKISSGLYQINTTVPASLASGDHEVELFMNGARAQSGAFLTVARP